MITDSLEEMLRWVTDTLGKLYGLPGYVLVFLLCLVAGFVLKRSRWFPNDGIPLTVICLGGLVNSLIADPKADTLPLRIWVVKNVVVGLIIGFAAWQAHAQRRKIPGLKRFFPESSDSDPQAFTKPPP